MDPEKPQVSGDSGEASSDGTSNWSNSFATQQGRGTGADDGTGTTRAKYIIAASSAGSGASTEVSSSADAADRAGIKNGIFHQDNVSAEESRTNRQSRSAANR